MYREPMTTSRKCKYSKEVNPSKMLETAVVGYQDNNLTKAQAKKRRRAVDRSYKNLQKELEEN